MSYVSGTDFSANAPALLANLLATSPVNFKRQGWACQNQSGDTIQIVLDDGAGGTPTIFLCDPGAGANKQGADWSLSQAGIVHYGRIRVFSSSPTDQVGVREY